MNARAGALLLALAAFAGTASCTRSVPVAPQVRFNDLANGVQYARLYDLRAEGERIDGHAFRIDLEAAGLRVLAAGGPKTRREVATIARRFQDVVAVNGAFFDEEGKAMGLVVDQGRLISRWRTKAWGALVVKDRRATMMKGKDVDLEKKPELVLQGWPRLVVDGKVMDLKKQEAARTAVCADGRYVTIVVLPDDTGMKALASFLARRDQLGGLGCQNALNLDGGPSTQLYAKLGALTVAVKGGWGVHNALVALPGLPHKEAPPPEPDGGDLEAALLAKDGGATSP
jgi:hypothetical protein